MIGFKTGKLTVTGEAPKQPGSSVREWVCVCECGAVRRNQTNALTAGRVKTCGQKGCKTGAKPTHGASKTSLYRLWSGMKSRCHNPNNPKFYLYGGAGIRVCEQWLKFEAFAADMGPRPSVQHSLDRIDGSKGYAPGNVRWATAKEQSAHISFNRMLSIGGVVKHISEWARSSGINLSTLRGRLRAGLTGDELLRPPMTGFERAVKRKNVRMLTMNGESLTLPEWARRIGVSDTTLRRRLRLGWTTERLLAPRSSCGPATTSPKRRHDVK